MDWDTFCNQVKETATKAANKINQTADLAALQVKLNMSEKKLTEAYAKLGEVAYRHFSGTEALSEEIANAILGVEDARKIADDYRAEIEQLKAKE